MHRKLFALARDNAERGSGIRSEVTGDVATIYVYDVIDPYWGISSADMAATLQGISAPNIDLRINCPGGDVFEARAMMTLLSENPATITAKIDGIAASAASVLALAASQVQIAAGGFYMIHEGWTLMMGGADDLRSMATALDKVNASMVTEYAAKTGKPDTEIAAWMKAETWFSGQEAVDAGFADALLVAPAKAKAQAFNLAVYEHAPKALTDQPAEDDCRVRARIAARARLYERTA